MAKKRARSKTARDFFGCTGREASAELLLEPKMPATSMPTVAPNFAFRNLWSIHDALVGLSQLFINRAHGLLRILQQFNSLPLEFEDMRSTPEY